MNQNNQQPGTTACEQCGTPAGAGSYCRWAVCPGGGRPSAEKAMPEKIETWKDRLFAARAGFRDVNEEGLRLAGIPFMLEEIADLRAAQVTDAAATDALIELERLRALLNTPELHDFAKGVALEAAHQREKWGSSHDGGKAPADWFWLIGYLAQKAMMSQIGGETNKALHHTITTAAAMANWHAAMLGQTEMRPGIESPARIDGDKQGARGGGA